MSGRMGHAQVTVRNLEVIELNDGVLLLKGLVPGSINTIITITRIGANKKHMGLYKEVVEETVVDEEKVEEIGESVEEQEDLRKEVEAKVEAEEKEEKVAAQTANQAEEEDVKEEKTEDAEKSEALEEAQEKEEKSA
jgi:hypothetical protein